MYTIKVSKDIVKSPDQITWEKYTEIEDLTDLDLEFKNNQDNDELNQYKHIVAMDSSNTICRYYFNFKTHDKSLWLKLYPANPVQAEENVKKALAAAKQESWFNRVKNKLLRR